MRMNIEIDDALLQQVMKNGNYPTKKAAVEAALQTFQREYGPRRAYRQKKDADAKLNSLSSTKLKA